MRKVKLRKVKRLAQVPTPRDGQSLTCDTDQPGSKVRDLCQQHTAARVCFKLLQDDIRQGRAENTHRHQRYSVFRVSNLGRM